MVKVMMRIIHPCLYADNVHEVQIFAVNFLSEIIGEGMCVA